MAFTDSAPVLVEGNPKSVTKKYTCKMRNKRMWKSLRAHILSRRELSKRAEAEAELLRKKKYAENQQKQDNELSLAQINGRLSELRDKRNELEEEKRELLNQKQTIINTVLAVPEPKCANYDRKLVTKIKFKSSIATNIAFPEEEEEEGEQQQQQQQQQQHLLNLLQTQPSVESSSPILMEEFDPRSVIIPTNVKGNSKQNYWIFHQPN